MLREIGCRRSWAKTLHRAAGFVDRRNNSRVGSTAANVPLHELKDFGIRWIRFVVEQRNGGHDHTGSAVRALHCCFVQEGLLNRVKLIFFCEPLYCGNGLTGSA